MYVVVGWPLSQDSWVGQTSPGRFTGVSTSYKRHLRRHHLVSKTTAPEMTIPKTWGEFFDPVCSGGGKWRPFRFRSPSLLPQMRSSKMATGSGRAAISTTVWNYWILMMTWSNAYIFHVTGPLWGEFTGHWWIHLTKASNTESWCFLWSALKQIVV